MLIAALIPHNYVSLMHANSEEKLMTEVFKLEVGLTLSRTLSMSGFSSCGPFILSCTQRNSPIRGNLLILSLVSCFSFSKDCLESIKLPWPSLLKYWNLLMFVLKSRPASSNSAKRAVAKAPEGVVLVLGSTTSLIGSQKDRKKIMMPWSFLGLMSVYEFILLSREKN